MDDDLLGGLDGAGALCSGGVLARQCGAELSGCALAGAMCHIAENVIIQCI